jgi:ATP-dependent DNA helicase RecG
LLPRITTPLADIVGGRAAAALAGMGIETVADLLGHYPRRYAQRGELSDLRKLLPGEQATVLGRIASSKSRRLPGRAGQRPRELLEVEVTDGDGRITLTFFNQGWRARELLTGRVGLFAGEVGSFRGQLQLLHPDYQLVAASDAAGAVDAVEQFAGAIIPIYPASAKLPTWRIADCVRLALPILDGLTDPLDAPIRTANRLVGLAEAYRWIHAPADMAQVHRARARLRWDEAFGVQVVLAQRRAVLAGDHAQPRPGCLGGLREAFDANLPFQLTAGQAEVGEVLDTELARATPMHRLLQGDVGSGKTVVALRAMLQVVDSGGQAALLAPTEVLAAQHVRGLRAMMGDLARAGELGGSGPATRIALLTGSQSAAARRAALAEAGSGDAGIVVGTHALLEESVRFLDLGLVVIDEQHRFGVEQRAALAAKSPDGSRPHTLVMTATPIPRTVAMTVFGDLEVATLREMPVGRVPITTHVVPAAERPGHLARVWQRAREEVLAGRQVYVVCPRIDAGSQEDDEPLEGADVPGASTAAVDAVLPRLSEQELAGLRLAGLTGRMPGSDKDSVMRRFADPSGPDGVDVLVATTVIEVGVDVPNAAPMVILDADRFGVSQLHQLRGRVGRGSHPGLCLLVTNAPPDSPARVRLAAVAATSDGFELSRLDLTLRREGDVLGAAQSGTRRSLRLLRVIEDEDLIRAARVAASALIDSDPDLRHHEGLAQALADTLDDEHAAYLEKS